MKTTRRRTPITKSKPKSEPAVKTADLPEIVRDEEGLLSSVTEGISSAVQPSDTTDYDAALITLRDALLEENLPDDQAMLLEQMDRMAALSAVRDRPGQGSVDRKNPYFAHMRLEVDELGERDILLGRSTFLRQDVRIVDWRNAPISQVFYRYREGDPFAEEIAGRQMEGEVLARRVVTVMDGKLVRVAAPQGTFLQTREGWRDVSQSQTSLEGGAGSAARPDTATPLLGALGAESLMRADKRLPEIAALLDEAQFKLLTRDPEGLLVVAGGAGSGKTTVGLHRLAWLVFQDSDRFRARRMLVMVFGKALARYISQVLPALGVDRVPVQTLGDWSLSARKRHFPALTPHISGDTPAVVVRFKTHRILLPMLEQAARDAGQMAPESLFEELFTDRGWVRAGVQEHGPGAFSDSELEQVHRWCTDQHFKRVDPRGHEDDEPACYDEEDSMILLRLQQLLRGPICFRGHRKLSYDHMMVDEVQDFSPLELMVLLDTVRDGSVTLAGDPAQRITDNDFSDWSEVLVLLGKRHVRIEPLQVSYRSTRQVMELARAVLGPLAPSQEPGAAREGAPAELLRFAGRGPAMTFLADALDDLTRREPAASVAVLTCTARQADEAYLALSRCDLANLSRIADQEFSFGPGIEVTDVAQTKGLEFDYVVLLGVDRQDYPVTPSARHLLHVACTRAIHQLWLLNWRQPSALLPDWLEAHLGG